MDLVREIGGDNPEETNEEITRMKQIYRRNTATIRMRDASMPNPVLPVRFLNAFTMNRGEGSAG